MPSLLGGVPGECGGVRGDVLVGGEQELGERAAAHAQRGRGEPVQQRGGPAWGGGCWAVGLAAEEYQLGNAELEAIQRVRGNVRADRHSNIVTQLTQVDPRPRAELLRDGVSALVWLRALTW
jgi:hypothetical protein